jgi:hypothetical protein
MRPDEGRGETTARGTWAKAMGCWCASRPGFPTPVGSRWGEPERGVVAWVKAITARGPSPWERAPARGPPGSTPGCRCRQHGPRRRRAGTKRVCPKRPGPRARVPRWPWRGWRHPGPRSGIGGWPGLPRWGVRPGAGVAWRPWPRALCWRSPRTPRSGRWRRRSQSSVGREVGPRGPGTACRPGATRLPPRQGGASMAAMGPKVPWWWRWSNGVWSPAPTGVSKVTRHEWRCCATVTARRPRACKSTLLGPRRPLRPR